MCLASTVATSIIRWGACSEHDERGPTRIFERRSRTRAAMRRLSAVSGLFLLVELRPAPASHSRAGHRHQALQQQGMEQGLDVRSPTACATRRRARCWSVDEQQQPEEAAVQGWAEDARV